MLNDKKTLQKYIDTILELIKDENRSDLKSILQNYSNIHAEETGFDNWDGGQYYYTINVEIPVQIFKQNLQKINNLEQDILDQLSFLIRQYSNIHIQQVYISPETNRIINWNKISKLYSKAELIEEIEDLKKILIKVATGTKIQEVNDEYKEKYNKVKQALEIIQIDNPNNFTDLWDWYKFWCIPTNNLGKYAPRRDYINHLHKPLLNSINEAPENNQLDILVDLTGWDKVKKSVELIKNSIYEAETSEEFQGIGLLCRETIISLAQSVYIEEKHNSDTTIKISPTDAKRMLDGFIIVELSGGSNEDFRRYARSSLDLANKLTHKRTATNLEASLCTISTFSLINFIGAISSKPCYF